MLLTHQLPFCVVKQEKRFTSKLAKNLVSMQKKLLVDKGTHGLQTSAARFHEALSAKLRKMGFGPSEADFDLWIRRKGDHHEHLTTHADDILAFSKNPMPIIREIRETFVLKGVCKPECCLGGDFHTVAEKMWTIHKKQEMMIHNTTCPKNGSKKMSPWPFQQEPALNNPWANWRR